MKKLLAIVGLFVCITGSLCAQSNSSSQGGAANIAGTLYASNFTGWTASSGTNGPFSWSSPQVCTQATSGGVTFAPFKVGSPIKIVDTAQPSNSEVVAPSAVNINGSGCSITVNPSRTHYSFYLGSATGGLQEAINSANGKLAVVILTPDWTVAGGQSAMITAAQGSTAVSILDERTSVIVPYAWNTGTSAYVAQPFGGGANLTPNAIQFALSPSTTEAATAAQVVATFGGPCDTPTNVLYANGLCAPVTGTAANPAGSNEDNQINIGGSFGVDHGNYTYNVGTHTLGTVNQSATGVFAGSANDPGINSTSSFSQAFGYGSKWTHTSQDSGGYHTQVGLNTPFSFLGNGIDNGAGGLTPNGPDWTLFLGHQLLFFSESPGIHQALDIESDSYSVGDDNELHIRGEADASYTAAADEGHNLLKLGGGQHTTYPTGVATTTTAPGAQVIPFNATGGRSIPAVGSPFLDTSLAQVNVHFSAVPTSVTGAGVWSQPVTEAVTPSVAWGNLLQPIFSAIDPLAPQKIAAQFVIKGGSTGVFTASSDAHDIRWIAGSMGPEQVLISLGTGQEVGNIAVNTIGSGCPDGNHVINAVGGGGTGAQASVNCSNGSPQVDQFWLTAAGSGYTSTPTFPIAGWTGSFTVGMTVSGQTGAVTSVQVLSFGSLCADGSYIVPAVGGGGTGSSLVVGCSGGIPFFTQLASNGKNYSSIPTFTVPGSSATFTVTIGTTQWALFTPFKQHVAGFSSLWQGGTQGFICNNFYAANFKMSTDPGAQPVTNCYQNPGAIDAHTLADQFNIASGSNPVPGLTDICHQNNPLTGVTIAGGSGTAAMGNSSCQSDYNNLAGAVISASTGGACDGAITNVKSIPNGFGLTWTQSGSATCANANISFPQSTVSYTIYQGAEVIQPPGGGQFTGTFNTEPNPMTVSSGHTFKNPQQSAYSGYLSFGVETISTPDTDRISQLGGYTVIGSGSGFSNEYKLYSYFFDLNEMGIYSGYGGTLTPPDLIFAQGGLGSLIDSAFESPTNAAWFRVGCSFLGCSDHRFQPIFNAQDGEGMLIYQPAVTSNVNQVAGNWDFENNGQFTGELRAGSLSFGSQTFGTGFSFTFGGFVTPAGDPFGYLGTGANDDGSAALSLGTLGAGTIQVGGAVPIQHGVFPQGTTGGTTYTYEAACLTENGHGIASNPNVTNTGNATLNGTNFNFVKYNPGLGCTGTTVYYISGDGRSPGAVAGCVNVPNGVIGSSITCKDTGAAVGAAPPTTDTTFKLFMNVADGCATWASGVLGSTASPCGSGGGGLTLTTTGSSGAATLIGTTLNIPIYTGGGGSGTITPSLQFQLPFFSLSGTHNTIVGDAFILTDGSGNLTDVSTSTTGVAGEGGGGKDEEGNQPTGPRSCAAGFEARWADTANHAYMACYNNDTPSKELRQSDLPFSCQPGYGDGANAAPAQTVLQTTCRNDSAFTWTIQGIKCYADSGSSTCNVTNGAGTALLTGAITGTTSYAAGTQTGTVTLASGDFLKVSFVMDGTTKQITIDVFGVQ